MIAELLLCHSTGAKTQKRYMAYTKTNRDWVVNSQTNWNSLEWARHSWNSVYMSSGGQA